MDETKFRQVYGESRNGCDHFVRHPLGRALRYSDGVQELAQLGCYWLLDIVATEIVLVYRKRDEDARHTTLRVQVDAGKAYLSLEHEGAEVWRKRVDCTDMPSGDWRFLLTNEGHPPMIDIAMILPSEY